MNDDDSITLTALFDFRRTDRSGLVRSGETITVKREEGIRYLVMGKAMIAPSVEAPELKEEDGGDEEDTRDAPASTRKVKKGGLAAKAAKDTKGE